MKKYVIYETIGGSADCEVASFDTEKEAVEFAKNYAEKCKSNLSAYSNKKDSVTIDIWMFEDEDFVDSVESFEVRWYEICNSKKIS